MKSDHEGRTTMKVPEEGTVQLCGVQGCCPTVEFTDDAVIITDEGDGRVRLTKPQWEDLKSKFSH